MNTEINPKALEGLETLRNNPYCGRGIVLGRTETQLVQVYWISGRSQSSRNRVFINPDDDVESVYTALVDPFINGGDTSLTIYPAMKRTGCLHVVSNGNQTRHIISQINENGYSYLMSHLKGIRYEPDAPNFTPRISGICFDIKHSSKFELSIIQKGYCESCDHTVYRYEDMEPGYGRCITTYSGDATQGKPLPPFRGEPLLVPVPDDPENILTVFWNAINQENVISVAVKMIDMKTGKARVHLRNRYLQMRTPDTREPIEAPVPSS